MIRCHTIRYDLHCLLQWCKEKKKKVLRPSCTTIASRRPVSSRRQDLFVEILFYFDNIKRATPRDGSHQHEKEALTLAVVGAVQRPAPRAHGRAGGRAMCVCVSETGVVRGPDRLHAERAITTELGPKASIASHSNHLRVVGAPSKLREPVSGRCQYKETINNRNSTSRPGKLCMHSIDGYKIT